MIIFEPINKSTPEIGDVLVAKSDTSSHFGLIIYTNHANTRLFEIIEILDNDKYTLNITTRPKSFNGKTAIYTIPTNRIKNIGKITLTKKELEENYLLPCFSKYSL